MKEATIAGGCFWCIEAAFNQVQGILSAKSGYTGGEIANPTYEQVCTGNTGHAEVVRLQYDEELISYREILEIFFGLHDPTQLNRQGNDVGTQYRSAVYYHDDAQKQEVEAIISEMTEQEMWPAPVVTEVSPIGDYFEAEPYHQEYFKNNPQNQYCAFVVGPKISKFKKTFANKLKS